MQRDRQYLLDMLESAKLATRYIAEKTRTEFTSDIKVVGK